MKQKYIIVAFLACVIFVCFSTESSAQSWKRNRKELVFGLGATGFLGDLGGLNKYGTDYSPVDLELSMTRPLVCGGMRYQVTEWSKLKGNLAWGQLAGDDKLTTEFFRNNRNLYFKSPIVEAAILYEIYFQKEKAGHRYNIRQAKGFKIKNFTTYGFVGFGGVYFNPKAKLNGSWVPLQPLGTEGQGLEGRPKKYSRITMAIPMGLGLNYMLNRQWKIGLEVGYRKTFTDYMDDVHDTYYDHSLLKAEYIKQGMSNDLAEATAKLADPNLGLNPLGNNPNGDGFTQGYQPGYGEEQVKVLPLRGQPQKDAYIFANFTVSYKIITFGSRAKF